MPAREWYKTRSPDDTWADNARLRELVRVARAAPPDLMLMRQFVSMASQPNGMQNYHSTGYLGLLFSDGHPVFEKPAFTRSGQERLDWCHALVNSLDAAEDRDDLKFALLKIMDILDIEEMTLKLPDIAVSCEMRRMPYEQGEKAGGSIWSWEHKSNSDWRRDLPQVISACQDWLHAKIDEDEKQRSEPPGGAYVSPAAGDPSAHP